MSKPALNIGADSLHGNCTADQCLSFCYVDKRLYFCNPKFLASSHLQLLYSPVCVGPDWNPEVWFSHDVAQFISHGRMIC